MGNGSQVKLSPNYGSFDRLIELAAGSEQSIRSRWQTVSPWGKLPGPKINRFVCLTFNSCCQVVAIPCSSSWFAVGYAKRREREKAYTESKSQRYCMILTLSSQQHLFFYYIIPYNICVVIQLSHISFSPFPILVDFS